jgi:hypothetical protein
MKTLPSIHELPPLPGNMPHRYYPCMVPLEEVINAILRWNKGERITFQHRKWWPGLCERVDSFLANAPAEPRR